MAGQAMKAEIIAIGSELLTPDRIDTNSLYLTRKLTEAGFTVHLKSIVGDSVEDIEDLLRAALCRSRCIVLCGGLGPTEDDCTRAAAANALRRTLSTDAHLLEALRLRFARRGVPMAKINERQAEIIAGAEILANPVGTAPGMWIEEKGAMLVLLPGPPRELTAMFESQVVPRLAGLGGGSRLERRSLGIHGLTESEVDTRIASMYRSYPGIQTTGACSRGMHLRLAAAMAVSGRRSVGPRRTQPQDSAGAGRFRLYDRRRKSRAGCRAAPARIRAVSRCRGIVHGRDDWGGDQPGSGKLHVLPGRRDLLQQ